MAAKQPDALNLPDEFVSSKIVAAITQSLEKQADDPDYKAGISRAVPGAPQTYGVRVPALRSMAKVLLKQYTDQPERLTDLSLALWEIESREHRLIALFVLAGLKKKLAPEKRWDLGVLFLPDVADWELCDQMCHALLGQSLAESPDYMNELESWLDDENFWVRRAAIVSTVLLRRAQYEEPLAAELDGRALAMCARLLDDGEHYIRKAVDWAVCEVIKRHEDLAYAWMMDQAGNGLTHVARSTLKLAAKKLPPERQKTFVKAVEI
jgi:3-methyladenine DNA glycosylase AlkD